MTAATIDEIDTTPERLAAYRTLSGAEKRAILYALYVREQLKQNQIAAMLGVAQPTVSRQLSRAGVLDAEDASEGFARLQALQDEAPLRRTEAPPYHVALAEAAVMTTLEPLTKEERTTVLGWAALTLL